MPKSTMQRRPMWPLLIALLSVFLTATPTAARPRARASPVRVPNAIPSALLPQQISQKARSDLRSAIESGRLTEMHWPDFSHYRKDVAAFYRAYAYALPWVRDMQPSRQALVLIARFRRADRKGLSMEDYDGARWTARLAKLRPATHSPSETDAWQFDLALTVAAMRYISALHTGRIDPRQFGIKVDIANRRYNLPEFLEEDVVNATDLPAVLRHVEPPYPGYRRTLRALQRYRRLAHREPDIRFPPIKQTVKPGDVYAGVPQLAHFLRLVNDLPPNVFIHAEDKKYAGPLVDALKRFQYRHGLTPDGYLGRRTLAELNVPLSYRVRQLQLTLERWRWLPREYAQSSIVVNIPEFRLRAYGSDFRIAVTMKVVVGKAFSHKTPIFMGRMRYVIFRPFWKVPVSIAEDEIIPDLEHDPKYLEMQDMEIVDAGGKVVSNGPVTANVLDDIRSGKLWFRQKPGPTNALGLVEFVFPNDYDVYLHGTPETVQFYNSRRDFSHGCIRLNKPARLAAWVLRNNSGWDLNRIRSAMNGDTTRRVNLARPVPVLIVYGTAIVLDDGVVRFYDDIYGEDSALERALAHGYPYPL